MKTPTTGQIKVIGGSGQTAQILRSGGAGSLTQAGVTTTTTQGGMSGIAALAAAAAATQKISTTTAAAASPATLKVVQPTTLVTPQGVKVQTTVAAGQTVRLISPSGQVLLYNQIFKL